MKPSGLHSTPADMPQFKFDCLLGGVVRLDCEIAVLFGLADRNSLRVSYKGKPFNVYGLLIDYSDEIMPLSEYLIDFAEREYIATRSTQPVKKLRAVQPRGKGH